MMTGPTFKFWRWTSEDWPYGLFIFVNSLLLIGVFAILIMAVTGLGVCR